VRAFLLDGREAVYVQPVANMDCGGFIDDQIRLLSNLAIFIPIFARNLF
jgi:hypothetical protein